MAHIEQQNFFHSLKERFPDIFIGKSVLEVGSQNINGTIRDLFEGGSFVGIDISETMDVDLVIPGEIAQFPDNSFDVVVTTECLEHANKWQEVLQNIIRQLKPGGSLIMTFAHPGRSAHGTLDSDSYSSPYTLDYYKNLSPGMILDKFPTFTKYFSKYEFSYDGGNFDTYFIGFRNDVNFLNETDLEILEQDLARARGQLYQCSSKLVHEKNENKSLKQKLDELRDIVLMKDKLINELDQSKELVEVSLKSAHRKELDSIKQKNKESIKTIFKESRTLRSAIAINKLCASLASKSDILKNLDNKLEEL